ncbi:MAG TPA: hypothetical protein VJM50_04375 [Pyrinomonadaceae bacterium]|nr:hypothetical protein [Pyrinomonadaceae bacterium]
MPNAFWTIKNKGAGAGNALTGLQIQQLTNLGVTYGYQLMNGSNLLQANGGVVMPIEFLNVEFAGQTWNLTKIDVTPGVNGKGHWAIVPSSELSDVADGDNGEFQAQAGTGTDPETASSANA